jgi:deoxyribose-phosphate aldolase
MMETPIAHDQGMKRNPGMALDLAWVVGAHVNLGSTLRRVEWLAQKRTVKTTWQAAWLLRAVTMVDLTTLAGDDTPGNVTRLCHKAKQPVRQDILEKLGFTKPLTVGAVCVYPARVPDAVKVCSRPLLVCADEGKIFQKNTNKSHPRTHVPVISSLSRTHARGTGT